MFINISNHNSGSWQEKQMDAARQYGEIMNIPFPQIHADHTSKDIDDLVEEYFQKILQYENPTVMLQGEFIFTFRLVTKLKKEGIKVVASRTERIAKEEFDDQGRTIRKSIFEFIEFMEY